MGLLPPVIARLIADTREYTAKMTEAQAKMTEFGATAEASGSRLSGAMGKVSTAVVAAGAAVGVYAVDQAYKFNEGLDKVKNQAGLTTVQTDALGKSIQNISNVTGIANSQLLSAALVAKQAGLNAAQTTALLTNSAKASVITGSSVVDVTKSIVAAQTLQVSKGMDVAKLTGILVKGSQDFVGGLTAEESMISGKIGVSLAKYGIGLKQIIPLGAEFAKIGLPTKSIVAFTKSLSSIEKPTKDAKGNLTSYAKGLEQVGVSQQKLESYLRTGNLAGMLTYIKTAAGGNVQKEGVLTTAIFGSSGSASALAVLKDYNAYLKESKNLTGAGAGTLNSGFSEALKQIGPQLNVVKANFNNLMINAGKLLLPAASTVIGWISSFAKAINSNPILKDLIGAAAGVTFGTAVAIKLKGVFDSVMGLFNKGAALAATTANTAALEANTIALGGKAAGVGTLASSASAAKNVAKVIPAVAVATAATALLQYAASHGPTYAQETPAQRLQSRSPMPFGTGVNGAVKKTTTVKVKVTK